MNLRYDKIENFLKTILKMTIETTLSSSYNYMCFNIKFCWPVFSQLAISIKVGAVGVFPNA